MTDDEFYDRHRLGQWKSAVLHVDVIHFKPDGIGENEVGNLWDKSKDMANTDTLKIRSVWDQNLALNDVCGDEDELAEAIGVSVEELEADNNQKEI